MISMEKIHIYIYIHHVKVIVTHHCCSRLEVGHSTCAAVFDDDPEVVGGVGAATFKHSFDAAVLTFDFRRL